jgi:hypothetical protein
MKKIFMLGASIALVGTMNAQVVNKKGANMLPQNGDWGISVKADPFINAATNIVTGMFGVKDESPISFDQYYVDNTFVGRRFVADNLAQRVIFNVGRTSNTTNTMVSEIGGAADAMVKNSSRDASLHVALGAGQEWRRGHGRLQGYYGADAMIYLAGGSTHNSFGNDIKKEAAGTTRVLVAKDGLSFGIGARGFLGAEYFFAPKMSVGAEFGWGLSLYMSGKGSSSTQSWDGTNVTDKTVDGTTSSMGLSLDSDQAIDSDTPFSKVISSSGVAALKLNLFF